MGCDIHWVLEVKYANVWVGVLHNAGQKCKADDRWYDFFGELAGVRHESPSSYAPRGLPTDLSKLTYYAMSESAWDHTGSWLSVDEFVAAYNRAVIKNRCDFPDIKTVDKAELFGLAWWPLCDSQEQRVVFAFDN